MKLCQISFVLASGDRKSFLTVSLSANDRKISHPKLLCSSTLGSAPPPIILSRGPFFLPLKLFFIFFCFFFSCKEVTKSYVLQEGLWGESWKLDSLFNAKALKILNDRNVREFWNKYWISRKVGQVFFAIFERHSEKTCSSENKM